jgi:protein-L-isoaspartate(D-aspartate) O-methyltransferase
MQRERALRLSSLRLRRWIWIIGLGTGAAGAGCDGPEGRPAAVSPAPASPSSLSEEDFRRQRAQLVDKLGKSIKNERLLDALRRVPRHEFVPSEYRDRSYEDCPLPIAEGQTISQPAVVASMVDLLEIGESDRVLEVGTGSGYQAAILGELAAEVYSIEIRQALKESAEEKLRDLKERGLIGYRKLVLLAGDGAEGYEEAQPYDAIIVTAAPSSVPVKLLNQLKPGGRLVIPVGKHLQELQVIKKSDDGTYHSETKDFVRFVPLEKGSTPRLEKASQN